MEQAAPAFLTASRIERLNEAVGAWPWYFYGAAGRGKSSIAALVYAYWPHPGMVFYWQASRVIGDLVEARLNGGGNKILKTVKDASLIVIDDIVDRSVNDMRRIAFLDILNERAGKPFILTGNFDPKVLNSETGPLKDDRVASRICAGTIFNFVGDDYRMKKAQIVKM